jgi:hypothetical protein
MLNNEKKLVEDLKSRLAASNKEKMLLDEQVFKGEKEIETSQMLLERLLEETARNLRDLSALPQREEELASMINVRLSVFLFFLAPALPFLSFFLS